MLGPVDNLLLSSLRPAACPRDPEILLNAKIYCTEKEPTGSRGQAAGRRDLIFQQTLNNIVIYGGSFDPVHLGHIRTAQAIQAQIKFDQVIFLPCKTPVLKQETMANSEHRIHMLKLAIRSHQDFHLDLREIQRNSPSYMVDTLKSFRLELGEDLPITLLMGIDAFIQLPQWHSWSELIKLCHLLIMNRPSANYCDLSDEMNTMLLKHETTNPTQLHQLSRGKIYRINAGEYPISSSLIRCQIKSGQDVSHFLTEDVCEYIRKNGLYLG